MPNAKAAPQSPPPESNPAAVGVDQQRDAPDGIERGRGRSDRMRLPHERDESPLPGGRPAAPTKVGTQAARDIERGLVDTERRGIPNDLPGPQRHGGKAGRNSAGRDS